MDDFCCLASVESQRKWKADLEYKMILQVAWIAGEKHYTFVFIYLPIDPTKPFLDENDYFIIEKCKGYAVCDVLIEFIHVLLLNEVYFIIYLSFFLEFEPHDTIQQVFHHK